MARSQTLATLFVASIFLGVVLPAAAQQVVAPQQDGATLRAALAPTMALPGKPMPTDASALDAMFGQRDWTRLAARLHSARSAPQTLLDMNWEQKRIYDGAGFLISYAYMNDLWRMGASLPPQNGAGLQQTAAMMFLYSLDLTVIDGPKCADVTAAGHRREQLSAQNPALIAYIKTLPRAERMKLGTISLSIEAATAALRPNDEVLCSGGLSEMQAGLKAQGNKPLPQVPNAPGTIGKSYAVPSAPGYAPQFLAESVWRPKQTEARAAMPKALTRMLTLPTDSQPPVSAK